MKTIIIIVFILVSSMCYGNDIKKLEEIESDLRMIDEAVLTETICIKGYWFVIANSKHGVSIIQIYSNRPFATETPKPIKCKG